MSDKVVLPRLDFPGQKAHWAFVAVIGGGVLVFLLAAIFLVVVHKQQAAQEASARAVESRAKEAAAQVEKMRLQAAAAEKARAEAAAAEKMRPAGSVVAGGDANQAGSAGSSAAGTGCSPRSVQARPPRSFPRATRGSWAGRRP